ncbi:MAG: UvrB/UvrC motif-containing protein [Clostridia bacterium]|nr:UvrB/UvrC motif-containing protein [Clostridia bacterium]
MLCQKCRKNNATLYYKENVNGKVNEYALCAECAKELEQNGSIKLSSPFGGFGDELFGMGSLFSGFFGNGGLRAAGEPKRCPLCGARFDELARSGKIGCPQCYETFTAELAPTINQVHGSAKPAGRSPRRFGEKQERARRIEALKAELSAAVQAQEFEKAVTLRDQIRELEAAGLPPANENPTDSAAN